MSRAEPDPLSMEMFVISVPGTEITIATRVVQGKESYLTKSRKTSKFGERQLNTLAIPSKLRLERNAIVMFGRYTLSSGGVMLRPVAFMKLSGQ